MSELVETPSTARNTEVSSMMDISPIYGYSGYYDFITQKITMGGNQITLILLFVIILLYYLVFASMGQPTVMISQAQQAPSSGIYMTEVLMWTLFIFLALTNILQYLFQLDIRTAITDIFTRHPTLDIDVKVPQKEPVKEITYEKQVFHIPDNKYTYDDAKAVCKAFGSRLATYKEVEKAYNDGGEWCSYGWSDGQMVLFPTQEATWKKLQKSSHADKQACGRPGVNGGYIDNPNAEFGINCYGYKPVMNQVEQQMMRDEPLVPESREEREFNDKVKRYRQQLQDIIVSPFNRQTWSNI